MFICIGKGTNNAFHVIDTQDLVCETYSDAELRSIFDTTDIRILNVRASKAVGMITYASKIEGFLKHIAVKTDKGVFVVVTCIDESDAGDVKYNTTVYEYFSETEVKTTYIFGRSSELSVMRTDDNSGLIVYGKDDNGETACSFFFVDRNFGFLGKMMSQSKFKAECESHNLPNLYHTYKYVYGG